MVVNWLYPRPVEPHYLSLVIGIIVGAALLFIWPLLGIHKILEREKVHLLRESSIRLEIAIKNLHARADAKDYAVMDGLNKLISSLTLEQTTLEKISTWPWKPETLRLFVTALLLPLLVFLSQRILAGALGF